MLDQPIPGQRFADSLKLELGLALAFWLPYGIPQADVFGWPYIGTGWLGLWMMCPLLTSLGLLALPRDSKLRWGWLQILLAAALAGSIWWKFSTIELF